ncbi:hypothetical protein PCA31118_04760 [Pandoraea captiosa]|uniref:Uncharacterized protein n=1 Tax=Pandoraea captiosa TaxID=2508302 RepID=A0A5E5AN48_9BURK|nr:hypothetical protein [Pandoraea captiosa]VVE74476.1 hypothetical protein PCA31118_04760 [Pandoraea captiosa]
MLPAFTRAGIARVNVTIGEDATPTKVAQSTMDLGGQFGLLSVRTREYANEFFIADSSQSRTVA